MTDETLDPTEMVVFLKYDATGRILFKGEIPRSMLELQGDNVLEGDADVSLDWIQDGAKVPRPVNPATLSGMTLENLPSPCTITVEGIDHASTDATCELSFSQPGIYTVKVVAWPMLDATFEVTQA
jgi:hypothetical protein